ncbi:hypothetical protein RU639_004473 [Aspergillus parasiticus]
MPSTPHGIQPRSGNLIRIFPSRTANRHRPGKLSLIEQTNYETVGFLIVSGSLRLGEMPILLLRSRVCPEHFEVSPIMVRGANISRLVKPVPPGSLPSHQNVVLEIPL